MGDEAQNGWPWSDNYEFYQPIACARPSRYQIPICTVILNNGLLGGYDGYLPISTEKYGTRNLSGHYAILGQALGGYAERIDLKNNCILAKI